MAIIHLIKDYAPVRISDIDPKDNSTQLLSSPQEYTNWISNSFELLPDYDTVNKPPTFLSQGDYNSGGNYLFMHEESNNPNDFEYRYKIDGEAFIDWTICTSFLLDIPNKNIAKGNLEVRKREDSKLASSIITNSKPFKYYQYPIDIANAYKVNGQYFVPVNNYVVQALVVTSRDNYVRFRTDGYVGDDPAHAFRFIAANTPTMITFDYTGYHGTRRINIQSGDYETVVHFAKLDDLPNN